MHLYRLLIACCILLATTLQAAELQYVSYRVSTEDGLASNKVYDMVQDHYGFLWMGSISGLSRYDGYGFINFLQLGYGADKEPANIGNLYLDDEHHLLWIRTAMFTYTCYNLNNGRFENYGGSQTVRRKQFRRCIMTRRGIWMYDHGAGIRHVDFRNGKLVCTDYTQAGGQLPSDKVTRIFEDKEGNMWGIVDGDILRIDTTGKCKVITKKAGVSRGNTWHGHCFFMTKDGKVLVYDLKNGRKEKTVQVPSVLGILGKQTNNFVWQDKWVLLSGQNTLTMDCRTLTFARPAGLQMQNPRLLDTFDGNACVDNNGELCLFMQDAPFYRRLSLMGDLPFTADRSRRFTTIRGRDGRFYIASYGNGLFVYDPVTDQTAHYTSTDKQPLIASNFLIDIFSDHQGCVWVSQEEAGLTCISQKRQLRTDILLPQPTHRGDWANNICMLCRDNDGSLLVSTRSNVLYRLDPSTRQFHMERTFDAAPYAYASDRQGHTWIGTRGDGLWVDSIHYTRRDPQHFIPSDAIYDIVPDNRGRLWIATWEQGLLMTQYGKGGRLKFEQFLNDDVNQNRINDMKLDAHGQLWIATYNGLYCVDTKAKNIKPSSFLSYNTSNGLLPFNDLRTMTVASDGSLWTGGLGTGVARLDMSNKAKPGITRYSKQQGLPNNNVYSLAEDNNGNIWAATEGQLARICKRSGRIVTYKLDAENISRNLFSENCAIRMNDGRLLFGTGDGVAVVWPSKTHEKSDSSLTAWITNLTVNGMSIYTDDNWPHYYKDGHFVFEHNENTLRFSFSNFDYANKAAQIYQYYLEGYERTWREATSEHTTEYGNLPPGKYRLHLRTVYGRMPSDKETSIEIIILQPWWNTWWAWTLYILLIVSATYYIYSNWRRHFNLKQQMKLEHQLTEFRIDFFTHIAHEFRTPLAIISGAAAKMSESEPQNISRKTIQTVHRGTHRLLQLANQLMKFRRVYTDNLRLGVEQADMVVFLREIYQDFWLAAQQKDQRLTFTPFDKQYLCWFDKHIVDTIVYNLLSNAVKYTPEHGIIELKLKKEETHLLITVEDNGPGVSADQQQHLFKPFMQGYTSKGGMGIGLYTAYKMALRHHGSLTYDTTSNGALFTLRLPADDSLYEADEYRTEKAIDNTEHEERKSMELIHELMPQAMNNEQVTIIEDDPDMLEQLRTEVGVYFRTTGHTNGQQGYDAVCNGLPALVVCDVMLPDMSGYDIVRRLKDNPQTQNIPVIMLTALDDESHQIKGYRAGADDYMVKPCNYHVLVARIVQLIQWNRQMRQTPPLPADTQQDTQTDTDKGTTGNTTGAIITSKVDKLFLERLQEQVTQHLSDQYFTIDTLAQLMCMGRTKFYGKVKELTGMSPNKYLLGERMRKAGELLYDGTLSVSEVCYRVGIQDPSYFNKCFKAHYGVPPSKYNK